MNLPTDNLGLMLPEGWYAPDDAHTYSWGPWDDNDTLARRLFAGMRALDEAGVDIILCPLPPEDGVGLALRDRLRKAARTK